MCTLHAYGSNMAIDHIGHSIISFPIHYLVLTNVLDVPKAKISFLFINLL
jgi:hypothetical protein